MCTAFVILTTHIKSINTFDRSSKKLKRDPWGVPSLLSNNTYVSGALVKVNILNSHSLLITEENDSIPDKGPSPFQTKPDIKKLYVWSSRSLIITLDVHSKMWALYNCIVLYCML